jgi:hypothetical protein
MRNVISVGRLLTRAFLPLFLTLSLLMGLYNSALTAGVSSAAENPPSAYTIDKLTNQAFGDVNKQQLDLGTRATRHASPSRGRRRSLGQRCPTTPTSSARAAPPTPLLA